jgi:signal transduction histidine kinase
METVGDPGPTRPDSLLDDRSDEQPLKRANSLVVMAGLAIVLAIIWVAFFERSASDQKHAMEVARERDAMLAVALEQYTVRVLKAAQAVNQYVSREYGRGTRGAALKEILDDRMASNDILSGLAILALDGHPLVASGRVDAQALRGNVGSVYNFDFSQANLVQVGGLPGAPPLGRELSVARGITDSHGRPQAIAVAFVEGHRFLGVFDKAKLSRDTLVLLAGMDGSIRATWNAAGTQSAGIRTVNLEALAATAGDGSRVTTDLDGVPRISGMRKLEGHPLLAVVATSEAHALADFHVRQRAYLWASATVSVIAVMVGACLLRMNRRRDRLAANLHKAKNRLRNINAELESRIARRTAQLASANRDLQLFTSALAHDVRAPLAAIDGFTKQLEPAIAATGNERLIHHLTRVRANAQHMSELTESMLRLARLSAHAVHMARVDVSAMASTVVHGLRERAPDREVDVDIHPGMAAYADPAMLREVLENLVGNAWKFTGRREGARIKIATAPTDEERTCKFFVCDNGAGFDMDFAGELFRPFHRLHAQHEFAGTGVGLAMVHRIIGLHGGRVSTESAPNQGATFFFTLPAVLPDPAPDSFGHDWH